eukprot:TRINITY_DN12380_c0_g1_i1.p1 TRINITY_DN12380_c0_g1~~TRINITY_DN12380_c0_g1_i1.p1  ORF type:complete len:381 (+),score=84.44 TRINITY_DN12380_c0_g1_i1:1299-2441(+)
MAVPPKVLDVRALKVAVSRPNELAQEFNSMDPMMAGPDALPPNVGVKNRYTNVLPTASSRVPLTRLGDDPVSEYINANYVKGYLSEKRFIAAQGPKEETTSDFWRMLWEQKCQIIVMMTGLKENGRDKCHRYWPEEGQIMEDDLYSLKSLDAVDYDFYILSTLELTEKASGKSFRIMHFWYTNWPDHGVPDETWHVIKFVLAVREYAVKHKGVGPIVVHCSAGIGRTGTFVAIDKGIQELNSAWRVTDIYGNVMRMRHERGGSVQTPIQYLFIHQALLDYVTPGKKHSMFGDNQPRDVGIIKSGVPSFGFTLRGSCPAFVLNVAEGSKAEASGVLEGDHLLALNQEDVTQLTHTEVVDKVRNSGNVITLTLLSKSPALDL